MVFLKKDVDRFEERKLDIVLKMLDELRDRILNLQGRLRVLERMINEKIPGKVLTERRFMKEIIGNDDIVDRIVSEIRIVNENIEKRLSQASENKITVIAQKQSMQPIDRLSERLNEKLNELRQLFESSEQKLTIVERKRMEEIAQALHKHQKLSSTQLSQLIGLSRTRCNEYFKRMESMGIVEPVLVGKEKFYRLS